MRRRFFLMALILGLVLVVAGEAADIKNNNINNKNINNPAGMRVVDYVLPINEGVKVRIKDLGVEFDDKGRPMKYTPEDLKKRKGDDAVEQKLPGYKSTFAILKPGDVVQVYMSKPKDKEKTAWVSANQNYLGIILDVDEVKMVLRVDPSGPPAAGSIPMMRPGGGDKKKPGAAPPPAAKENNGPPRVALDDEQRQATTILIVERAPEREGKRPAPKKKDK